MTGERTDDAGEERGELLGGAYRTIRRLVPGESPLPGELVAVGDESVVLVDVAELDGWPGWAHGESQHVLGVRDVARRRGGHDAVLSWCVRRLDVSLRAAPPLSGGGAVTLAVSLMRGVGEARRSSRGAPVRGAWWLVSDGRPAFVPTDGLRSAASRPALDGMGECASSAARILTEVGAGVDDRVVRKLLDEACALLEAADVSVEAVEALEERLFEARAPQPLERLLAPPEPRDGAPAPAPPARASERRTRRELRTARAARGRPRRDGGRRPGAVNGAARTRIDLRETIDAALSGRVAESAAAFLLSVRGRLRAVRDARGAPFLLGGVAAAAVIAGGLMWPSGEDHAAAEPGAGTARSAHAAAGARGEAERRPGGAATDEAATNEETASTAGAAVRPGDDAARNRGEAGAAESAEDPVAAAQRLLDGLAVCRAAGDETCGAVRPVGAPPLRLNDDAAVWLPADARSVVLLDDFGDLAVLRVQASDGAGAPQSVVIERASADERWTVRDVHSPTPGTTEGDG
ncbi:hypothetical protein [Microbacterium sp. Marseille-Q6965]|uniref:hypothetical protein n=1 Tax=Microbacterium sp. Marseille-Q6965 TaxID=2965072 RepID=UPI0021B77987|nr:hypothetical protein [Microbacterium sp. Marseille-Q6965]